MLRLHTEEDLRAASEVKNALDHVCAVLQCDRQDLPRVIRELQLMNEIMRAVQAGGARPAPEEIKQLPLSKKRRRELRRVLWR